MEGDAMKKVVLGLIQAKENEKTFNEKLLLCKQEIIYYPPLFLKTATVESGINSTEKQIHDNRISSTLGCYYSKIAQIPDEPNMLTITNDIAANSEPKVILFENTNEKDQMEASKFVSKQ